MAPYLAFAAASCVTTLASIQSADALIDPFGASNWMLDPQLPGDYAPRSVVGDVIGNYFTHKLVRADDVSKSTRAVLDQLDTVTTIATLTAPPFLLERITSPYKDTDLKSDFAKLGWKKNTAGIWVVDEETMPETVFKYVTPNWKLGILNEDDFFNNVYDSDKMLTNAIQRSPTFFPLEDSAVFLDDEEAAAVRDDLKLAEGQAMPLSYNANFNMDTVSSFSRLFFYGMGSTLLSGATSEKTRDGCLRGCLRLVVDIDLTDIPMRELYQPLGAKIYFDPKTQLATGIVNHAEGDTMILPEDPEWNNAMMQAKVSMFTLLTVREHLTWTHLIVSNDATRETVQKLHPEHPLRRLLNVFEFGATEVNLAAIDGLVPKRSLLYRSVGFTQEGMETIFDASYKASVQFQPFPEQFNNFNEDVQAMSKADGYKFPYASDGIRYYDVVSEMVTEWIENAGDAALDVYAKNFYDGMVQASLGQQYEIPAVFNKENLIKVVSQVIFVVTAYHELIGNVVDYALLPSRTGFRIAEKNPSRVDMQSYLNTLIISASTAVPMPKLMAEFPNYFSEEEKPLWKRFQGKLQKLSAKLKREENIRTGTVDGEQKSFKYFNPEQFECSVSV